MASNQEKIKEKYAHGNEFNRAYESRAVGMEFHYTKKILDGYIMPESSIIELGCGGGYYGVYFADRCDKYVGIDITPENIAVFEEKIKNCGFHNVRASVGDATNLYNIADGSFDVVLCLGPMYHLPPEERRLVFAECKRIAKPGAVLAFAYISAMGVYLMACLTWAEHYPNKLTNEYVLKKGTDDERPELFFYATPEQMIESAESHGLEIIKSAGVDFKFNEDMINNMSEEKFEAWLELTDCMTESESCAGLANHSLLICKKIT